MLALRPESLKHLYPLLTPEKLVHLESRNEKRKRVPVLRAHEIDIKFSGPLVCHIFPLVMFRAKRPVNVMSDLMEKNMGEDDVSQNWDMKWDSLQSTNNLVYSKLDVR